MGTFAVGPGDDAGDCGGWDTGTGIVFIGDASRKDPAWTSMCTHACDAQAPDDKAHVYCFMQ